MCAMPAVPAAVRLLLVACGLVRLCDGLVSRAPAGSSARTSFAASLHGLLPEDRLRKVTPVAWVHVPKTGATFMNAVLHLPGVCPGIGTAEKDYLCNAANPSCMAQTFAFQHGFFPYFPLQCTGLSRFAWHYGFNTEYMAKKGHAFAMMRQPEQRLLSGYFNAGDHQGWDPLWGEPRSIHQYAQVTSGLAVKMLTRDIPHQIDPRAVRPHEPPIAVQRLREGFAFIGLTEQYELSICLLHKMFGGECNAHEFMVSHRGNAHAHTYNVTEHLGSFRDHADNLLYDEATRIFSENLQLYNVSWATCRACFEGAGRL